MLRGVYPEICLVHLYALEGAIHSMEFNNLSENKKRELKEYKIASNKNSNPRESEYLLKLRVRINEEIKAQVYCASCQDMVE